MANETRENVIKREELYKQVWKIPICRLASRYGMSDVGLAKICKKLKIPRPPRGYWAKLEFGKKVKPPALPKLNPGEPDEHTLFLWARPVSPIIIDPGIKQRISAKIKIVVPDRLSKPHQLAQDARQLLENTQPDNYGMLSVFREPCLDVRISRGSLNRALRVLDSLIKGFEAQGLKIKIETDPTTKSYVEIFDEKVWFSLVEDTQRSDHVLTLVEKRRQQEGSFWGAPRYDYSPSGKLSLIIDVPGAVGIRKRWSDSPRKRLEELLGDFVNGTILVGHILKKERLMREEQNRKWEEERKKREEEEKRRRENEARLHDLERQAEQWAKSKQLRAYIRAVEREVAKIEANEELRARFERWFSWAKAHAEFLDPIRRNLVK